MVSKIDITFNEDLIAGDFVNFRINKVSNPGVFRSKDINFIDSVPLEQGEAQVQTPIAPPGRATAIEYELRWRTYYGIFIGGVGAQISRVDNTVTITYSNINVDCYIEISNYSSNANVTAVINNCDDSYFTVNTYTPQEAASPCSNVEVSVTTSEVVPKVFKITEGVETQIETNNLANPYLIDLPRGQRHRLRFEDASGNQRFVPERGLDSFYFPSWNEQNIDIEINPGLSGSSLVVSLNTEDATPTDISFEYSLDGVTYQNSNVFSSQPTGSGTMYVKDNWGCINTKSYEVEGLGTRDPFLFISSANSLIFAENEVVDNCNIFRNDNNALQHQGLENIKFCEPQLFQTCDITKIQFKSNYLTPTAFLRNEDGSPDVPLLVQKRSANLNRFQRLDCTYYKYRDGKLGIYFTTGTTYDEAQLAIGTYSLLGNLPDFARIGNYIDLDGIGILLISDVVFDPTIQKKAIVCEFVFNGSPTASVVECYYDLLNFEVYEFQIDWSVYGVGLYDVLITNDDPNRNTVQHLSENISIEEEHPETLHIRYFNDNNRDIFYKYGIENIIRVPFLHIQGNPLDENEINITDLSSQVVDSSVHEIDKVFFAEVSKKMMRKLVIALSCENVYINGVGYIKNGNIAVENESNTNSYLVVADMLKTNINYNNNRQGQQGYDEDDITFDIPPFVIGDGGFVKG